MRAPARNSQTRRAPQRATASRSVSLHQADFQPGSYGYRPKRTAFLRKLKETFRRFRSQPLDRVVELINPALRGWVGYFALGNSNRCFSFIKDWVEKKARRNLGRARKRQGFCWNRWSKHWLYETVGCSMAIALITLHAESAASMIGHINFDRSPAETRSVGKPPATFDEAGAGDMAWLSCSGTRRRKSEQQRTQTATYTGAPVLDPTLWGWAGTGPRIIPDTAPVLSRKVFFK